MVCAVGGRGEMNARPPPGNAGMSDNTTTSVKPTGVHSGMTSVGTPKANALLAALPKAVYRRLLPELQATRLRHGDTLLTPGMTMKYAYFPTSSIVAVLHEVDAPGTMAKAWPVGREGVLGISLFLGKPHFVHQVDVEIGGTAFRLPVRALLAEFRQGGAFQQLLLRYVSALITQASPSDRATVVPISSVRLRSRWRRTRYHPAAYGAATRRAASFDHKGRDAAATGTSD